MGSGNAAAQCLGKARVLQHQCRQVRGFALYLGGVFVLFPVTKGRKPLCTCQPGLSSLLLVYAGRLRLPSVTVASKHGQAEQRCDLRPFICLVHLLLMQIPVQHRAARFW